MVCPIANRLVTTARALPQAGLGILALTKLVAAAGTMSTLTLTSADDSQTPAREGSAMGRTAPLPSTIMVAAMGMPSARPLKTCRHTHGASNVMLPSRLHIMEVTTAGRTPATGF